MVYKHSNSANLLDGIWWISWPPCSSDSTLIPIPDQPTGSDRMCVSVRAPHPSGQIFLHSIRLLSILAQPDFNIYIFTWTISALSYSLCAAVSKFLYNSANPGAAWLLPFSLLPYLCSSKSGRTHLLSVHFPLASVAKPSLCLCLLPLFSASVGWTTRNQALPFMLWKTCGRAIEFSGEEFQGLQASHWLEIIKDIRDNLLQRIWEALISTFLSMYFHINPDAMRWNMHWQMFSLHWPLTCFC